VSRRGRLAVLLVVSAIAGFFAGAVGALWWSYGLGPMVLVATVLLLLGLCAIGSWIAEGASGGASGDKSVVAVGPDSTWDIEELEV